MSSEPLDNLQWSPRSPAARILMTLKMHGVLSSAALGEMLGTSGEAARQQLARLAEDGLVEQRSEARGVGRPLRQWRLTAKAEARFPDTHAALTVQVLRLIRAELGDDALDRVIAARETLTENAYGQAIGDEPSLKGRVAVLARFRAEEGYMSEWWEEADGRLMLVENHCPICAAASECQGFCRAELQVFHAVLGADARIERSEHLLSGGRRCAYVITPVNE